tara:strand:+ start:75 stop:305 length:231 start_codon:yes stop_codon:yes gene_type:complete
MINAKADLWFTARDNSLDGYGLRNYNACTMEANVQVDIKVDNSVRQWSDTLKCKLLQEMFPRATSADLYFYEEKEK